MNRRFFSAPAAILFLLLMTAGCVSGKRPASNDPPPAADPAHEYFARLHAGVERARLQMPEIIRSAEQAARRVVAGRRICAAGSQVDFTSEMIERAGGMMGMQHVPKMPERGDVVLLAARSQFTNADKLNISQWRQRGVYVIAFASKKLSNERYFPPDVIIDSGDEQGTSLSKENARTPLICPTDAVTNLINGWVWQAEFIAACTRLGRMPVVYRSYHLPGGREWAEKYRGRMFHDDLKVDPIGTGTLGSAYLDHIDQYLANLEAVAEPALRRASEWLVDEGRDRSGANVTAHIFPDHFKDTRAPQPFSIMSGETVKFPEPTPLLVMIGYQQPPQFQVDLARQRRMKLVYSCVQRAADDYHENVIYINPQWPMTDACVDAPGYPHPILPASGVLDAAIYWSLVAETYR